MSKENPDAIHDPATCYQCGAKNNESRLVKWQKLREITCKSFKGEYSPYWDYMGNARKTEDEEVRENRMANPDVLVDNESSLKRFGGFANATEKQEFIEDMSPKVQEALLKLTPKQRFVLEGSVKGYTEEKMAEHLKVSQQSVNKLKQSAAKKMQELLKDGGGF